MAESIRERIVQNVVTTLEGIRKVGGYSMDLRYVDRFQVGALNPTHLPNALVIETSEEAERRLIPATKYQKKLALTISILLDDGEKIAQALNNALADVEKALMVDTTRGGLAIDTRLVRNQQFVFRDTPNGEIDLEVEIQYRHNAGDPYSNS